MVELNLDMLSLIYRANSCYDKVPLLLDFLDKYRMLQMLFRVCVEQRVITERQYAGFALTMEKIGKQGTGWKQYNEKGEMKTKGNDFFVAGVRRHLARRNLRGLLRVPPQEA